MRVSHLFLVLFLLQGCASSIVMTDSQNLILTNMTESSAAEIVKKIFTRTNEQTGLLGSNSSPFITDPKIISIENGLITYADYEEHVSGIGKSNGGIKVNYDHTNEKFHLDLRKVNKIRTVNGFIRDDLIKSIDGTQFGIHAEGGILVNIDVKKEYVDEAIAVFKFYCPDAI